MQITDATNNKHILITALSWDGEPAIMDCDEQKELIAWFCKNKPELIREIFCEDCIEHTGL